LKVRQQQTLLLLQQQLMRMLPQQHQLLASAHQTSLPSSRYFLETLHLQGVVVGHRLLAALQAARQLLASLLLLPAHREPQRSDAQALAAATAAGASAVLPAAAAAATQLGGWHQVKMVLAAGLA
jgi:hypothetical protein